MDIEWDNVKKWTLWHYEDLIKKIEKVLEYNFIQQYYNHAMKDAQIYASCILNFSKGKYSDYQMKIKETLQFLDEHKIRNYSGLISAVRTRELCEVFLNITKIPFQELIQLLNYLFRWVLPFSIPIMEFIDKENEMNMSCVKKLREYGIKSNLDLLEHCRAYSDRNRVSFQTDMSVTYILELVNKADISRLPYIRGKTANIFYNAGYDKLQKIAESSIDVLTSDLTKYLQTIGVKFSKSFIEPDGTIAQAKAMPSIVEQ